MKSATYSTNNLLVNQVKNLHHSERQVQSTIENNRIRENIPELKTRLVYPAKGPLKIQVNLEKQNSALKTCEQSLQNGGASSVGKSWVELFYSGIREVEIIMNLSDAKHEQLKSDLLKYSLELMEDKKCIIVEKKGTSKQMK